VRSAACTVVVSSVLFLVVASGAEARKPRSLTATTVPMVLYPRGDLDQWTVVRMPHGPYFFTRLDGMPLRRAMVR
jgi:hypothetical protein